MPQPRYELNNGAIVPRRLVKSLGFRGRYSLSIGHTTCNTAVKGSSTQPLCLEPIGQTSGFISDSYPTNFTRISDLFYLIAPLAILRGVIAIVIYTVKRVVGARLFTHIFQKVIKTVMTKPSVSDTNTPTAIPMITPIFLVETSLFHRSPRVVFRSVFKITSMPVIARIFTNTHCISAFQATKFSFSGLPTAKGFGTVNTNTSHTKNYNVFINFSKGIEA